MTDFSPEDLQLIRFELENSLAIYLREPSGSEPIIERLQQLLKKIPDDK